MAVKNWLKNTFSMPKREEYKHDNTITSDSKNSTKEICARNYVTKNYKGNGYKPSLLPNKKDLIADVVMLYRFNNHPCEISENIAFYQQDYVYKYGVNPIKLAKRLVNENYLVVGLDNDHIKNYLNSLKANELKEMLKLKNLITSGNKNSLANRVRENYSLKELIDKNNLAISYCFLTEKGTRLLSNNLDLIELHNDNSGIEYTDYIRLKNEHINLDFNGIKNMMYEEKTKDKINKFISDGYEYYKIATCEDDNVCDACSRMTNKKFKFSEIKVGVNFPPFHDGCRCSFDVYVEDWDKWIDEYAEKHNCDISNKNTD